MDMEEKINEQPQKNHANVLAKVKKAISAALMAGMLASPMAAETMKNNATYREPTRVERSVEQVSQEQVICNEAMKLFEDIISSDLKNIEKLSALEITKQAPTIVTEVKGYINRLYNIVTILNDSYKGKDKKNYYLKVLEEDIMSGTINETMSVLSLLVPIYEHLKDFGVDEKVASEVVSDEYQNVELQTFVKLTGWDPKGLKKDGQKDYYSKYVAVSDKNGLRGNVFAMWRHPEQKELCMKRLQGNIENLSELMTNDFGTEQARKATLWVAASSEATQVVICELEQIGYKLNETNLRPDKAMQQQAGQEIGR